jgi:hypothetical protein
MPSTQPIPGLRTVNFFALPTCFRVYFGEYLLADSAVRPFLLAADRF